MAQPCTRPLLNNLAKKLWPHYQGKRAGRSIKAREANRIYNITQVNPRKRTTAKRKSTYAATTRRIVFPSPPSSNSKVYQNGKEETLYHRCFYQM